MHEQGDAGGGEATPNGRVRVALLTPVGRGAVAVVGVAGTAAPAVVDRLFRSRSGRPVADRADGAICFGRWQSLDGGAAEEVVVARLAADRLEVHCHGGLAAPEAIVRSLARHGADIVPWQTWLRPGDGGPADRDATAHDAAVEARIAVCRAGGPAAARILCRQIAGALDLEIDRIRSLRAAGDDRAATMACDRLLRAGRVGLRLTTPWRIAVVGPVNAGKSSLVNALAGHARSLVSPLPGTTRDLVTSRLVIDGWEIELVDTAGLRDDEPAGGVERAGIARAVAVQAEVDLVLRVTPADRQDAETRRATEGESGEPARFTPAARPAPPAMIEVVSKVDLVADSPGRTAPSRTAPDAVLTSAVTGAGIDRLAKRIVATLVPETTAEPDLLAGAVPFTAAQLALIEGWRCRGPRGTGVSPSARPPCPGRGAGA